jgi:hypothetical protein
MTCGREYRYMTAKERFCYLARKSATLMEMGFSYQAVAAATDLTRVTLDEIRLEPNRRTFVLVHPGKTGQDDVDELPF